MKRVSNQFKQALRLLIFPWFIWWANALLPRRLRRLKYPHKGLGRKGTYLLQTASYSLIGLPLTVLLLGEVLITANEALLGEQAEYRLESDFEKKPANYSFEDLPGPKSYRPPPVEKAATEEYRKYLVELFSPVIVHKIANHPEWDIPLLIDYDGNDDPRDNVINEPKFRPHLAGLHGEMTAETTDSYYLTYSLYHIKDYDHPLRELMSRWTYHDNDNEGFHIRVDKESLRIVEVETWFHNRFLLFNLTGETEGTEPVHGRVYVEDDTHLIVYAQPQGHGVRCAQLADIPSFSSRTKIYRYRGDRPHVLVHADDSVQTDVTYEIDGFDKWYSQAQGPLGSKGLGKGMFEEAIVLNPDADHPRIVGRFIAGYDFDVNGWSRPKPMWSWDDGWDEIPIFVWHFFPSLSFQSHGGSALSHEYLYNRPCEKVFNEPPPEIARSLELPLVRREGDKWQPLHGRGGKLKHRTYWNAANLILKGYVNYLFHELG